ncbi:MAG TPA: molybdopterin cofactor-binding domain-containing protein [Pseudolabrys sp.]|nr:molybdopterin cofactor-binding domain-containing protein [Pseudolabrys sp.]
MRTDLSSDIEFTLNGTPVRVAAGRGKRLSQLLRDDLKLTGTKVGCDAGDCGACTVLVNELAVCSCLVAAGQIEGETVETVEGLSGGGHQLNDLQESFLHTGAAQCGICTPGMLMAATALLRKTPKPSREQVEEAIGGVLCRCTGYRKIIDAVLNVVDRNAPALQEISQGIAVGSRVDRVDGVAKICGTDLFGADSAPPDALWLRFVRSPHHRAKFGLGNLANVVTAHPGLVRIFTASDVPGGKTYGFFSKHQDHTVFADGQVRYRGEAIMALVGTREAVEGIALDQLPIEWFPETPVSGIEAARSKGAAAVHEAHPDNIMCVGKLKHGDVPASEAEAALTVTGSIETSFIEHAYIEPEAGYARRLPGDRIEIVACTQSPYLDRDLVAGIMGIPPQNVRIVPTACGGGFGGKLDLSVQPALAIAAWHLGKPVRCTYGRIESMASSTKRHPGSLKARLSVAEDGRFLAYKLDSAFNTGAYSSWGPTIAGRVPNHGAGPYRWQSADLVAEMYYTNDTPAGAFRGFGVPQAALMLEGLIDEAAIQLGMDPLEIRRMNSLRAGDRTVTSQLLSHSVGQLACFDALRHEWQTRRAAAESFNHSTKGPMKRGVGVAACIYGCGNTASSNPSTMRITLERDGGLTLYNGAVDIGQGSSTVILQIAADAVGLPMSDFRTVVGDTDLTLDAGKSSASRQTYISGRAAQNAGQDLRNKILLAMNAGENAKLFLDGSELQARQDGLVLSLDLNRLSTIGGSASIVLEGTGTFDPPTTPIDADGQGTPFATYIFGAHLVDLTVDCSLGTITVNRVIAAHDVGRVINPTLAEGQVQGAVAQGIGLALMEEFLPGRTENLHDYLIPTAGDVPPIDTIFVEDAEPLGPFGAKGVGEGGIIPTPAAVMNAIRHATGVRLQKVPALPHRVLAALAGARDQQSG